MELELFYKIIAYILAGILGVSVGSFLNVVIYRTPLGMRLDKPDSHCPKCKYKLRWYDNIPVVSYIILGGKCRKCKEKISFRYTAVEIFNMLAWLLSVFVFWDLSIPFAVISALCTSILICVFFIDLEYMLVFDRFVIMISALGIAAVFLDKQYGWLSHLIGAAVGFCFFYGIYAFFYYVLKKDALGGGDIKLTAAMGLLLGWERLTLSLVISSISAAIILLVLSRSKNADREREYPFAPFLCVGFLIALFFGKNIIDAYLRLFTF